MKLPYAGTFLALLAVGACSAPRQEAPAPPVARQRSSQGAPAPPAAPAASPAAGSAWADPPAAALGPVDVEHYDLALTLHPAERRLEGACTLRLHATVAGLNTVALDLVGLEVREVLDGAGRRLEHVHDGGILHVQLAEALAPGRPLELTVRYGGRPAKGLWFAGDGDGAPTHAFTQGECEDARWWFPCVDTPADRATSELRVDVPAAWTTLAAGTRVDSRVSGERRVDRWRMTAPHPPYLTTLVAGELSSVEERWRGLPLVFLAPARYADRLAPCLDSTDDALEFLERVTGRRYPWDKYATACVEGFPFGGMENVSATTLTVAALRGETALRDGDAEGLVVHEAAHQWFGDLLTCADWSQAWLNEGFATYMTLMYVEEHHGPDAFRVRMADTIEAYLDGDDARRRPLVYGVYRDPLDLFFTGHVYAGGAARLHLLRSWLGDAVFRRGIQRYVGENAGRSVTSADLRAALEAVSGRDLGRFFEQWVHSPGHPVLESRWRWDAQRERVLLTVLQTQPVGDGVPEAFELPVDVEVRTESGSRVHRLTVSRRRELFELPADGPPRWVRFDKFRWLPARVVERKGLAEWTAVCNLDDDVNGRRAALRGLLEEWRVEEDEGVRAAIVHTLAGRLEGDGVAAVRADAAEALGRVRSEQARGHLERAAAADPEPAVRVAALRGLCRHGRDAGLARLARERYAEDASFAARGAAASLVASAEPERAAAWLTLKLASAGGPDAGLHGELRRELLAALGELEDPDALEPLLSFALDGAEPEPVRAEAARGLARHAAGERRARRALERLLEQRLPTLRGAAVEALAAAGGEDARAILAAYRPRCTSSRERLVLERALGGS